MKKLLLIILISISLESFAQYDISFSAYSSLEFSKGIELRGEFEDWYIAFQAENFIKDEDYFFNWGGSVGMLKRTYNFDYTGGIRVGFMVIDGESKPLFGLESEIDYKINESVFIGVRATYDKYFDSPNVETPTSKQMLRGFVKIGYKF